MTLKNDYILLKYRVLLKMTLNNIIFLFSILAIMVLVTNAKDDTSTPLAVKLSLNMFIVILQIIFICKK